MSEELNLALLEAILIMRWNSDKTTMSAVLTVDESEQMCLDVC